MSPGEEARALELGPLISFFHSRCGHRHRRFACQSRPYTRTERAMRIAAIAPLLGPIWIRPSRPSNRPNSPRGIFSNKATWHGGDTGCVGGTDDGRNGRRTEDGRDGDVRHGHDRQTDILTRCAEGVGAAAEAKRERLRQTALDCGLITSATSYTSHAGGGRAGGGGSEGFVNTQGAASACVTGRLSAASC
ncbi:Protein of unknown function [Gryllus bimaculatus]|nr:Protein of unknown function [Gryllus bimaculatus]